MQKATIIKFITCNFQKYSDMNFNEIAQHLRINIGANIDYIISLKSEILEKIVKLEDLC